MLLYRQVPLRQMLPAGVATGACATGLGIVSAFFFSDQVTSGQKGFGPAGVVIALITFLIGFGVCLHAGAVFGRMWNEHQAERNSLDKQTVPIASADTSPKTSVPPASTAPGPRDDLRPRERSVATLRSLLRRRQRLVPAAVPNEVRDDQRRPHHGRHPAGSRIETCVEP